MYKQILVYNKKRRKTHWLKGCSCGEKFAWLTRKFCGNFSGDILVG